MKHVRTKDFTKIVDANQEELCGVEGLSVGEFELVQTISVLDDEQLEELGWFRFKEDKEE